MSDRQLREAATAAKHLGLVIQLGTKGITPERLTRYLRMAEIFDARLVRSMIYGPDARPSEDQAQSWLQAAARDYQNAGVTLALETYEQVPTTTLTALDEQVGSNAVGLCLDPANVVARLEHPRECVEEAAQNVLNLRTNEFA